MPRSASLPPDDALQGNLFGAPEPAAATAPASEPEAVSHDLSDDELGADAAARPRKHQAGVPKPVVQRARQVLDKLS